jgi:hypothetical protein
VIVPQYEQMVHTNEVQNPVEQPLPIPEPVVNEPIRRSQRPRRSAILNCYETYFSEDMYDVGKVDVHVSIKESISSEHSAKWVKLWKMSLSL